MRKFGVHIWVALCGLCGLVPALYAQATVELSAPGHDAYVGEALELRLEIGNYGEANDPELPAIAGASLRQAGSRSESSQMFIVNGRMSSKRSCTFAYELIASAPGELTIPPFAVVVDGKRLETRPLKLNVLPSDANDLLYVEVGTGRKRVYVGQKTPVTMTIWVKPARYVNQLLQPAQMLRQIRPIDFGPFPLTLAGEPSVTARPGGDPQQKYYAFRFASTMVAEQPGPLRFDNIEIGIEYPTSAGIRNIRARATPDATEILPVPTAGRPADYAGAVGLFDIKTSATPNKVRVGDPVELTIDILGDGPLESLPPPELAANAALTDGFRVPDEKLPGEVVNGRRRFRVVIRPRSDAVQAIPALSYPYFDPDAERFVTARSAALPLTVEPAAEIAAPQLNLPNPSGPHAELQALDGLRDIVTRDHLLLASSAPLPPATIIAACAAPAGLFGLTWIVLAVGRTQHADPARRRRQQALRIARRRLGQARGHAGAAQARTISAALAEYLADRYDQPAGRLTGAAGSEFLRQRGTPPELVARWAALIQRCDETVFAGSAAGAAATDTDALDAQALACLEALEREHA
jgi:hypothetical protein